MLNINRLNSPLFFCCSLLFCSTAAIANDQPLETSDTQAEKASSIRYTLKNLKLDQFTIDAKANQSEEIKDPFQPMNRAIYSFNSTLDKHILRPVAVQYKEKLPEDVRSVYGNFRHNLSEPWSAFNQLIQGKPKLAAKSFGRFTLNTLTSLGFADTAKQVDLTSEKDGFADTLGVWGVNSGPYLVLPLLGPSTLRDGTGSIADGFARPQAYVADKLFWSNAALEGIDARSQFLDIDSIVQGDQYAALRDVYLQQRAFTIASKRGLDASDSMFMDDEFSDDEFLDEIPVDNVPENDNVPNN